LARAQPRSGTAATSLGLLDGGTRRRHSGLFGFGVGLLAALLISLLTVAMRGFLGHW
jgi:hypothetical protein